MVVHAGRWHVRLLLVVSSALLRRSMGCTQESFVFQALPLRRVVCNQCIISPVGPALHGRVRIVCLTCILWHASSLSVRRCIRCLLPLVPFVPILCGCWLDLISPACSDSAGSTLQPVLLLCWGVGRWGVHVGGCARLLRYTSSWCWSSCIRVLGARGWTGCLG